MIAIELCENSDGLLQGFRVGGHADYAEYGKDVVCAAVSALSIATANALEQQGIILSTLESTEKGLRVMTAAKQTAEASIRRSAILELFSLGVSQIAENYGATYIQIHTIRI